MKWEILKYKKNILQNIFYMWWLAITHEILIINVSFSVSEKGVITVHHANYGRRELGTCPDNRLTRSDCYFTQTYSMRARYIRNIIYLDRNHLRIIQQKINTFYLSFIIIFFFFLRCNGKRSCHLDASNSVFSDPCYRLYKYLEVTYSCIGVNE